MSKIHLIIPDVHSHYQHSNERANWLGYLINDVRPDVVVNLGDTWDFPSLSSYDKGYKSFQGRSFKADLEAGLDFNERVWSIVKKTKRRLPHRVFLIGNHEQRIARAVDLQPELEGTISYNDLELEKYYDIIVPWVGGSKGSPGVIELDGVFYAHYFVSGVMGRAISGEHPAYTLLTKQLATCTQGHVHTFDFSMRTNARGNKVSGLVAGCYIDYDPGWPGEAGKLWSSGVVIKRGVDNGNYDIEWVSIDRLKKIYE